MSNRTRTPPPLPEELRQQGEKLAQCLLGNNLDAVRAVAEAENEYGRHWSVRARNVLLKGRPDKIPLINTGPFCTNQTYWFHCVLSLVLLDKMKGRLRSGLATPDELIATYLLTLLQPVMRKWVDPLAITLASILLGELPHLVKVITNSPESDAWHRVNKKLLVDAAASRLASLGLGRLERDKVAVSVEIAGNEKTLTTKIVRGQRADGHQRKCADSFLEKFAFWSPSSSVVESTFFDDRFDEPHHGYDREQKKKEQTEEEEPKRDWNDYSRVLKPAVSQALDGLAVLLNLFPFSGWVGDDKWIVPNFILAQPGGPSVSGGPPGQAPPSSRRSGSGSPRSGGGLQNTSRDDDMDPYDLELTKQRRERESFEPFDCPLRVFIGSLVFPFDAVEGNPFKYPMVFDIDRIRVFGRDSKGDDLLLAVLPLPDAAADSSEVIQQITLEAGQRIEAKFHRLSSKSGADEPEEGVLDEPDARWEVEISYSETRPARWLALALQRSWNPPEIRVRRLLALAVTVVAVTGAGYGVSEYGRLVALYADVVAELGYVDPFDVEFSAVGRSSLEVRVEFDRNIVKEAWVDWGDPNVEGEEKLYPSPEVSDDEVRPGVRSVHDYGVVGRGGLRTVAAVRIVPTEIPEPRPSTLTADKLTPDRRLLVLPVGLILDPPAWQIEFVSPAEGEIVSSMPEVELRVGGVTAPIHLLAREASTTGSYLHLATLEEPSFAEEKTLKWSVDLSPLGPVGAVDIRALSAEGLRVDSARRVDPDSLSKHAPEGMTHLSLPAAVLEPVGGAEVGENETIHLKSNLDGYVAVAIRPVSSGTFWIQNSGLPTTGDVQRIASVFGAVDDFEFYVGITDDPDLFVRGDTVGQLQDFDSAGNRVVWVGPVIVHRKE
jgi:hypothetical protein